MTAEEKAKELIEKYRLINYDLDDTKNHKEAALIAVDEVLQIIDDNSLEYDDNFWQEVKTIITNY